MTINMSDLESEDLLLGEKLLDEFPEVEIRDSYNRSLTLNPSESNQNYLNRHKIQALWLLKNSDLILEALVNYYEGVRPSNK